jgi:hypothetical protein
MVFLDGCGRASGCLASEMTRGIACGTTTTGEGDHGRSSYYKKKDKKNINIVNLWIWPANSQMWKLQIEQWVLE